MRAAAHLTSDLDALRHRLVAGGALLTPPQYERLAAALERVGLAGAALLLDDLVRTVDADEADARPLDLNGGRDGTG